MQSAILLNFNAESKHVFAVYHAWLRVGLLAIHAHVVYDLRVRPPSFRCHPSRTVLLALRLAIAATAASRLTALVGLFARGHVKPELHLSVGQSPPR